MFYLRLILLLVKSYLIPRSQEIVSSSHSERATVNQCVLFICSYKEACFTSLATINFSVFRRAKSCKVVLYCDSSRQNPSKFICWKVRSSFEIIYFFRVEQNSSRNIQIFRKNSAKDMGKHISPNLMKQTPL